MMVKEMKNLRLMQIKLLLIIVIWMIKSHQLNLMKKLKLKTIPVIMYINILHFIPLKILWNY